MEEIQQFPKMLYMHPEDETKEQTFIIVDNQEQMQAALDGGYRKEQHIPQAEEYDKTIIVQGSGSERYEAGAWTDSVGQGVTDDTTVLVPKRQDSPKDILEDQHMNDKPNGEKVAE